jgi:tetratricopeptide (TPR) repeat protein
MIAAISGIDQVTITTPKEPQDPDPPSSEYDVSQAGRMNADYVVTGSFDRRQEPAKAVVKLTQATSGEVIWSRQYTFPWSTLVKAEQEMGTALASRLSLHLGEKQGALVARVAPASMEAYREFLLGHYAAVNARRDANLEAYNTALTHLEKALLLEPGYPDAHATLAGLYAFRLMPWSVEGPKFLAGAETHAKAALERAPRNSDALSTLARCALQRGDLHEAMRMATHAVDAEPGSADSLSALAEVYTAMGFHEAALEAYSRASRKSFVAMEPFVIGAVIAGGLGKLDVAEDLIRRHGAVDPESVLRLTVQGVVRGWRGDHPAAEAIHRQVRETLMARDSPEQMKRVMYSFVDVNLALALAKQNKLNEAREMVSRMPPPMPRRTPLEIQLRCLIGQTEEAIRLIEKSAYFRNYRFLVTDPELKPLYAAARFQRLLEETHPMWVDLTRAYGQAAMARPPSLPPPTEFLRAQAVRRN